VAHGDAEACKTDMPAHADVMLSKPVSPAIIGSLPGAVAEDVQIAVKWLSAVPRVVRIWLYSSGTGKRPMDERSDLDFAVEGLASGREYGLWSELDEKLSRPLDLVRCEDASPLMLSEIRKGILLYEA
jgi:predicted nucleotidyltransferase